MSVEEIRRNTGSPRWCGSDPQPEAREGQIGPLGVADGSVLPTKPGNAGGGKGPEFKESVRRGMRAGRVANAYDLRERFRHSGRRSAPRPHPQSWACFLVREPGAGNPPAGFDERGVETEHGQTLRHRPSKEPATDYAGPTPPRSGSPGRLPTPGPHRSRRAQFAYLAPQAMTSLRD